MTSPYSCGVPDCCRVAGSRGECPPGSGYRFNYFALGPASAMFLGMLGYFLAKFSENMVASLLAAAS